MKISTRIVESLESWINKSADTIPSGAFEITWVGQAGFLIRSNKLFIGIDLYLSDSLATKYKGTELPHTRMMQAPVGPDALGPLDLVLCTHGHTDHMDGQTLVPLCSHAQPPLLIIPRFESERAHKMGIPLQCTVALNDLESFIFDDTVTIAAVPAAHDEQARQMGQHQGVEATSSTSDPSASTIAVTRYATLPWAQTSKT